MLNHESDYLEQAGEHWRQGLALEAGRIIFENLHAHLRPKWASTILHLVLSKSGISFAPIESLLDIVDQPSEWANAKCAFSLLRESTLELERMQTRSLEQEMLLRHLYLAENVSKVIYNSTHPPDEFDEDSGWWIAVCLKSLVDWWNDDEFADAAWAALRF